MHDQRKQLHLYMYQATTPSRPLIQKEIKNVNK